MKGLNSAGALCLLWVWSHVFPALMENSVGHSSAEGRLPVPPNLNFRNKANRNTVFCTESNIEGRNHPAAGLNLLGVFWGRWLVWVLKFTEVAASVLARSVKGFHVWWGAESSFCQLWVPLELPKELFWAVWDFPANTGAASPINQTCHIFHRALPMVCASSGAKLVLVALGSLGFPFPLMMRLFNLLQLLGWAGGGGGQRYFRFERLFTPEPV